ncbi:MAG TPA: RHS repeat-associated core domain-containing protein, partial [Polyangiaceae bacterium]|nr:RHS repeat-associated core domain-containing protein [Polyangiaceae bacterium]
TRVRHIPDVIGLEVAKVLPGGARIETRYDELFRIAQRRVLVGILAKSSGEPVWVGSDARSVIISKTFSFDDKGKLVNATNNSRVTSYEYDARLRLRKRETNSGEVETFGIDEASNHWETHPGASGRRYAAGDRLLSAGTKQFSYDGLGRIIAVSESASGGALETRYEWNGQNQLAAIELPDGSRLECDYDPFGRRLRKRLYRQGELQREVRFVWYSDLLIHEVCTFPAAERYVRTFAHDDGRYQAWAQRTDRGGVEGDWEYFVADILGTPEELIDSAGKVLGSLERSAYGRARQPSGATTPLRFPGQFEDEETGLHYNYHRYYDPDLGRYLTPDPVRFAGGPNFYAYCGAEPIGSSDVSGLDHNCGTKLTIKTGDKQGTWVPESNPANSPQNPKAGVVTSGHTKDGVVHDIPGASNGSVTHLPPLDDDGKPRKTKNTEQPTAHTEQHSMEWAEAHFGRDLRGSNLELSGELPPCTVCNAKMAEFSKRHESTVEYKWPTNNHVKYEGGVGPTPVPGTTQGAFEQSLADTYAKSNAWDGKKKAPKKGGNEYWEAKHQQKKPKK